MHVILRTSLFDSSVSVGPNSSVELAQSERLDSNWIKPIISIKSINQSIN